MENTFIIAFNRELNLLLNTLVITQFTDKNIILSLTTNYEV